MEWKLRVIPTACLTLKLSELAKPCYGLLCSPFYKQHMVWHQLYTGDPALLTNSLSVCLPLCVLVCVFLCLIVHSSILFILSLCSSLSNTSFKVSLMTKCMYYVHICYKNTVLKLLPKQFYIGITLKPLVNETLTVLLNCFHMKLFLRVLWIV